MVKALLLAVLGALLATCSRPPSMLDEVRALGELRVVTRMSPTTYYQGAKGPAGPEYDLVAGFARFLGVELRIESVDRVTELIPALESGRAHVAAAGLTVTEDRARRVDFGPAYQHVRQLLVYRRGTARPGDLADLAGQRIEVVAGTSYAERLRRLQSRAPGFVFTENPSTDVADLLVGVAAGELDLTVADSNLFRLYRNIAPEIRIAFELAIEDALAWAFPKRHDDSLIREARRYLAEIRTSGRLAGVMDRYYGHTSRFDYVGTRRFIRDYERKLPAYEPLFRAAAGDAGLDWRLLAAIGYQESHWNPDAVSPTGVRGIMMLTENTASFMGIDDRIDPAQSIVGGAAYLARMKRRFPAAIPEPDLTWFALAAYNIGFSHVQDARSITRRLGQDDRLWVNVRPNFEKLSQRRWYQQTRHGYAPGWEPVAYVENVRNYYDILRWLTGEGAPPPDGPPEGAPDTTLASLDGS